MKAALLCFLSLILSLSVASQPAGKNSAASAPQRHAEKDQNIPRFDTTSLEKTIREVVKEAGQKHDPNADEKLEGDKKLVEYTRLLAIDTHRLAEFTFWLFVVTGGMVVVVAGQLWMFRRQLGVMKGDSKSTELAAKAADTSAKAVMLAERAYIFPEFSFEDALKESDIGIDNILRVNFWNNGKTPSEIVKIRHLLCLREADDGPPQELIKTIHDDILMPPGIGIAQQTCFPSRPQVRIETGDIESLKWWKKRLYVAGRIDYIDVFKSPQVTGYCWEYKWFSNDWHFLPVPESKLNIHT